jgi:hypothetical protein
MVDGNWIIYAKREKRKVGQVDGLLSSKLRGKVSPEDGCLVSCCLVDIWKWMIYWWICFCGCRIGLLPSMSCVLFMPAQVHLLSLPVWCHHRGLLIQAAVRAMLASAAQW